MRKQNALGALTASEQDFSTELGEQRAQRLYAPESEFWKALEALRVVGTRVSSARGSTCAP